MQEAPGVRLVPPHLCHTGVSVQSACSVVVGVSPSVDKLGELSKLLKNRVKKKNRLFNIVKSISHLEVGTGRSPPGDGTGGLGPAPLDLGQLDRPGASHCQKLHLLVEWVGQLWQGGGHHGGQLPLRHHCLQAGRL